MQTDTQKCLMLGIGHKGNKRFLLTEQSRPDEECEWTTLDINPDCHPDVVYDLNDMERGHKLPFPDDYFDEIHAYEVMEHYGRQGDYVGFFTGMRELWRVLKPGGSLLGTSPGMHSVWAWGDPGHTRVISAEMFGYLDRRQYEELGKNSSSDYQRHVNPCWWVSSYEQDLNSHIHFALMKEPARRVL